MTPKGDILDRVEKAINRARDRIGRHRDHIAGHETRTRVILIDPLLRSLDWDTEDPESVVHEHPVGPLKVDYALFVEGNIFAVIEAKALGRKLNDNALVKFVGALPDVPVIAFTNGDEWRIYRKTMQHKRETIAVSSGDAFKTGWWIHQRLGFPDSNPPEWVKLSADFRKGTKPKRIRFSKGAPITLEKWSEVIGVVAEHLIATRALTHAMVPVVVPGGKDYLVSSSEFNSGGRKFYTSTAIGNTGLWANGHGGYRGAPTKCIQLLKACDVDPSIVELSFV